MNVICSLIAVPSAVFLLIWAWRILNWAWFKPRRAEKLLREQGLSGNSYRVLFGDVKEMAQMGAKAKAKPMDFTNDFVPRAVPFIHKIINTYGMFPKILICLVFAYQLWYLLLILPDIEEGLNYSRLFGSFELLLKFIHDS